MNRFSKNLAVLPALSALLAFGGPAAHAGKPAPARIRAVAFDAFPVFDPRPVAQAAEAAFPGQGARLMEAWRTRMFEYQWLRALGGRYEDFMATAEASLLFAARQTGLDLDAEKRERLLREYRSLKPWPDAAEALRKLGAMGVQLVFLSNMTEKMLRDGLRNAGLEKEFRHVLSTDRVRTYKPDPRAYALATEALGIPKEEIVFAAFAGWDVAGAEWYGYPTFWVNRTGTPGEGLGAEPDGAAADLAGLVDFVARRNQGGIGP